MRSTIGYTITKYPLRIKVKYIANSIKLIPIWTTTHGKRMVQFIAPKTIPEILAEEGAVSCPRCYIALKSPALLKEHFKKHGEDNVSEEKQNN